MMEDILYYKDLHDPIEGNSAKPSSMSKKECEKMHRETTGVSDSVSKLVCSIMYLMRQIKANTLFAIRKLVHLKLKEGRSVVEHLSEFQDLVNQLTRMNLMIGDELQALLFLSSLPNSWDTLVVSLSNFALNGILQLAVVKENLFNEETKRKDMGKDNAHDFVTENMGRE